MGSKYDYDKLNKIVSESKTKTECIIKLGLNPSNSGNFDTLNRYIRLYNLDISHFKPDYKNLSKNNNFKKIPTCKILIKNSTYTNGRSLKKRLYNEGIKEKKCEKCGQDEIWNGEKISLILDHINGINDDHREENLRILCPNCNATLDTHCGKNKRIKSTTYDLCKCGKEKYKGSVKCIDCYHLSTRKQKRPSYKIL